MIDGTEKPKIPLKFAKRTAWNNEFSYNTYSNTWSNGNQIILHTFLYCFWKVWEKLLIAIKFMKNYGGIGFETSLLLEKP